MLWNSNHAGIHSLMWSLSTGRKLGYQNKFSCISFRKFWEREVENWVVWFHSIALGNLKTFFHHLYSNSYFKLTLRHYFLHDLRFAPCVNSSNGHSTSLNSWYLTPTCTRSSLHQTLFNRLYSDYFQDRLQNADAARLRFELVSNAMLCIFEEFLFTSDDKGSSGVGQQLFCSWR